VADLDGGQRGRLRGLLPLSKQEGSIAISQPMAVRGLCATKYYCIDQKYGELVICAIK